MSQPFAARAADLVPRNSDGVDFPAHENIARLCSHILADTPACVEHLAPPSVMTKTVLLEVSADYSFAILSLHPSLPSSSSTYLHVLTAAMKHRAHNAAADDAS